MGIDLLDMIFRVEKRFGIKIPRQEAHDFLETWDKSTPTKTSLADIQVCDFVFWVESLVAKQNPQNKEDIYEGVKQDLMECLYVEESEVTPEAWLMRDLGLS